MNRNIKISADISEGAFSMLNDLVVKHERSKGWLLDKMIRTYCQSNEKPQKKEKVKMLGDDIIKPSKVAEIYNEAFSGTYARQKQVLTDSLKASIRARSKNDFKTEESWIELFDAIKGSDFLMGKIQLGDRKPFQLSLEWIVKPTNLAKILEGTYHE